LAFLQLFLQSLALSKQIGVLAIIVFSLSLQAVQFVDARVIFGVEVLQLLAFSFHGRQLQFQFVAFGLAVHELSLEILHLAFRIANQHAQLLNTAPLGLEIFLLLSVQLQLLLVLFASTLVHAIKRTAFLGQQLTLLL
jgi:hypothetical protein